MTPALHTARSSPAHRAAAPFLMLFLSLSGMAVGLAIDCGSIPPDLLATICAGASGSFLRMAQIHWDVLPAAHVMMLVGAGLAVAMTELGDDRAPGHLPVRRLLWNGGCAVLMLAGMVAGAWASPYLAGVLGLRPDFAGLTGAMAAGMALAMLPTVPLYRR